MSRSSWKLPFEKSNSETLINRSSVITPSILNKEILVHNGKLIKTIKISEDMIGLKIGSLCNPKKKTIHKVKKNLKAKNK